MIKIFDLHNDLLTGCDNYLSQLKKYKSSNNKIILAFFRGNKNIDETINNLNFIKKILPKNCYLSFEDIGYDNQNKIQDLLNFKPIYFSLTWNGENNLAYGCNFPNEDIKPEGINIINMANKRKIALDTAHISRKGFYTIIDKADFVLCSHTALNSVYSHKRNVTDDQIRLIIEKGGIIGLCLYNEFISESESNVEKLVKHIDYFVNKFGYKNLSFGTDFFGAKDFIKNVNNYQNFSKIVDYLIKIGYNIKVINYILYFNAKKYVDNIKFLQNSLNNIH